MLNTKKKKKKKKHIEGLSKVVAMGKKKKGGEIWERKEIPKSKIERLGKQLNMN